jgi:hypothetical protein
MDIFEGFDRVEDTTTTKAVAINAAVKISSAVVLGSLLAAGAFGLWVNYFSTLFFESR